VLGRATATETFENDGLRIFLRSWQPVSTRSSTNMSVSSARRWTGMTA